MLPRCWWCHAFMHCSHTGSESPPALVAFGVISPPKMPSLRGTLDPVGSWANSAWSFYSHDCFKSCPKLFFPQGTMANRAAVQHRTSMQPWKLQQGTTGIIGTATGWIFIIQESRSVPEPPRDATALHPRGQEWCWAFLPFTPAHSHHEGSAHASALT